MITVPDSDEELFWAVYKTDNVAELYEVGCAIGARLRGYVSKRFIEAVEYDIWPPDFEEGLVMSALRRAQQDAQSCIRQTLNT